MLVVGLAFGSTAFAESQEICICKAIVAVAMDQDPSIMLGNEEGINPCVYYTTDDGTLLEFKCKLNDGIAYWTMLPEWWLWDYPTYYYIDDRGITIFNISLGIWKTYLCK
jgi:hypothetical protein